LRATKAELNKEWDEAFQLYAKAAEDFLHISRTAATERRRSECKAQAGTALQRAERIKEAKGDLAPVTMNPFSERGYNSFDHRYRSVMVGLIQGNSAIF
jgi:calpain-7